MHVNCTVSNCLINSVIESSNPFGMTTVQTSLTPERLISSSGISRSELRRTLCRTGLSRLSAAPHHLSVSLSSLAAETGNAVVWLLLSSQSVPLSSPTHKFLSTDCCGESGTGFCEAPADLGGETCNRGAAMTVGGDENVYTRLLPRLCLQHHNISD